MPRAAGFAGQPVGACPGCDRDWHGRARRGAQQREQLAQALAGHTARVVITTLQKFPFVLDKVAGLASRRYALVIDEAHSSQSGGKSSEALKRALGRLGSDDIDADGDPLTASALARGRHPNLSYFAFTATPKNKTLQLFGRKNPATGDWEPFHTYAMRQAIDEGFILDVLRNYLTYQTYWRLRNAAVEEASRQVDPRKAKARLVRAAELHPTSQEQRAQIIVDHFREHAMGRLGGRAKAMVVTRSREHAVRLYQAIRAYTYRREAALATHKDDEDFWQEFFETHPWILQTAFSAAVFMLNGETYLGGKMPVGRQGKGDVATDFLFADDTTKSFAVVEIKTPGAHLIGPRYRGAGDDGCENEVYAMHADLSGGIVQARNQIAVAVEDFQSVLGKGYEELNRVHPKGVPVIGSTSASGQRQKDSFNQFRHTLHSLTVITFDELLKRLKLLFGLEYPREDDIPWPAEPMDETLDWEEEPDQLP